MPSNRTDWTDRIRQVLEDGPKATDFVLAEAGAVVPPGTAYREGLRIIRTTRVSGSNAPMPSKDELIRRGRRNIALRAVHSSVRYGRVVTNAAGILSLGPREWTDRKPSRTPNTGAVGRPISAPWTAAIRDLVISGVDDLGCVIEQARASVPDDYAIYRLERRLQQTKPKYGRISYQQAVVGEKNRIVRESIRQFARSGRIIVSDGQVQTGPSPWK